LDKICLGIDDRYLGAILPLSKSPKLRKKKKKIQKKR
jgi:hypothetical protein